MVITVVWGAAYLVEAAVRVLIVQATSAGTALAVSKVLPYAVAAVLIAWTVGYGRLQKRRGDRLAAAYAAAAEASEAAEAGRTAETEEVNTSVDSADVGDATAQADTGDAHHG